MEKKRFNGKAIYQPKGAAAEYAEWACNFHVGCSNNCSYCFNKRWQWGCIPTMKKCFKDENNALEVFEKELLHNLPELQKHGLFFSFTTDPCLSSTISLTEQAIVRCVENNINVKILTKSNLAAKYCNNRNWFYNYRKKIAIGFTLTGHDELETNASTNAERIEAMRKLHEAGFKTWASIEPIIDVDSSLRMISKTARLGICDLYTIGLESGKKYDKTLINNFINTSIYEIKYHGNFAKIYFKDSLLKAAEINREDLPANSVSRDYKLI